MISQYITNSDMINSDTVCYDPYTADSGASAVITL